MLEEENARRMNNEDREVPRKKRDPDLLAELLRTRKLSNEGAAASVEVDNTNLSPDTCADTVIAWLLASFRLYF